MEDDICMTEKFGEQDRKETRKRCRKKELGSVVLRLAITENQ